MPKLSRKMELLDHHILHIHQQQYVLKSGVILSKDNIKAEAIENYSRREITIKVSGLDRRNLITIIAHKLDQINDSYPG